MVNRVEVFTTCMKVLR